jgi:LemA protein
VWWVYTLEEQRRHTRVVTSTDSKGRTSTRTETYYQWHEIDRKGGSLPTLEVVDDTGSATVSLTGADVVERRFHQAEFRRDLEGGILGGLFDNRTGRYRETETGIAVGDPLFVVGEATFDEQAGIPVLTDDVMVSTRSEESHTGALGFGVGALVLVALAGLAVGSAYLLDPDEPGRPTAWLPGLGAGLLLLGTAWCLTQYNRLQLLAQSVERAWTLIDVQLQRRYDLIPNLAKAVTGHASHESTLLGQVAGQRWQAGHAQQSGQLAGEARRQTGHLRQVLAVAEKHPELTADESFLSLQRQLADTENRIAGARTFYNDTVTLLHNRGRSFPGVLVARLVRPPSRGLLPAEGFERTVPPIVLGTAAPPAEPPPPPASSPPPSPSGPSPATPSASPPETEAPAPPPPPAAAAPQ